MLSTNFAWCNMLGYTEAEIGEITFRDFTHPDDVELSEQLFFTLPIALGESHD